MAAVTVLRMNGRAAKLTESVCEMGQDENHILSTSNSKEYTEHYLIIGNGFDLECGLPTKYTDFLDFLSQISDLDQGKGFIHTSLHPTITRKLDHQTFTSKTRMLITNEWKPTINNYWFKHFKTVQSQDKWVDFESEIARVVKLMREWMNHNSGHAVDLSDCIQCRVGDEFWTSFEDELKEHDSKLASASESTFIQCKWRYKDLRDKLSNDLDALLAGFERYLRDYVREIEPNETNSIKELVGFVRKAKLCRILSFNYTKTFEYILTKKGICSNVEFCYVHGQIGKEGEKNHMVMGVDNQLTKEEQRRFLGFTLFHKYYQRIYKETNSCYLDWLDEINSRTNNRILWTFGHSMGLTDSDILREFITANGMETRVYYHSEDMFKDVVANLTDILDSSRVIKMTGGRNRSLFFQKQE
jgi:hypothetical protein